MKNKIKHKKRAAPWVPEQWALQLPSLCALGLWKQHYLNITEKHERRSEQKKNKLQSSHFSSDSIDQ